jgi:hypothetical protein
VFVIGSGSTQLGPIVGPGPGTSQQIWFGPQQPLPQQKPGGSQTGPVWEHESTHWLNEHTWSVLHAWPQSPQFCGSS